jgi:CrcB protein
VLQTLWIGVGAVLGANARYLVGVWAGTQLGSGFPFGTLIVNTTGSFALGLIAGLAGSRVNVTPEVRLLLAVGFLGAYTTFSSFTVETLVLARDGGVWVGILNVLANNLLGLACALVGFIISQWVAG